MTFRILRKRCWRWVERMKDAKGRSGNGVLDALACDVAVVDRAEADSAGANRSEVCHSLTTRPKATERLCEEIENPAVRV